MTRQKKTTAHWTSRPDLEFVMVNGEKRRNTAFQGHHTEDRGTAANHDAKNDFTSDDVTDDGLVYDETTYFIDKDDRQEFVDHIHDLYFQEIFSDYDAEATVTYPDGTEVDYAPGDDGARKFCEEYADGLQKFDEGGKIILRIPIPHLGEDEYADYYNQEALHSIADNPQATYTATNVDSTTVTVQFNDMDEFTDSMDNEWDYRNELFTMLRQIQDGDYPQPPEYFDDRMLDKIGDTYSDFDKDEFAQMVMDSTGVDATSDEPSERRYRDDIIDTLNRTVNYDNYTDAVFQLVNDGVITPTEIDNGYFLEGYAPDIYRILRKGQRG